MTQLSRCFARPKSFGANISTIIWISSASLPSIVCAHALFNEARTKCEQPKIMFEPQKNVTCLCCTALETDITSELKMFHRLFLKQKTFHGKDISWNWLRDKCCHQPHQACPQQFIPDHWLTVFSTGFMGPWVLSPFVLLYTYTPIASESNARWNEEELSREKEASGREC